MNKREDNQGFGAWMRKNWHDLREWISGIKLWQWVILGTVIAVLIALCVRILPWLGSWEQGDQSGFWDGLERFGNLTGLITVVFAILGFLNTKRILDYRTSDYRTVEEEQSNEAFDLFVRVSAKATDTASMEDFLRHCNDCCPEKSRVWPRAWRDGQEIHLASLFKDNNARGFQSSFHQELFETFGGDGERAKQRFVELLRPVVIRYGSEAILGRGTPAVYFLEGVSDPGAERLVAGERIVEIYFPMDLPARDSERRRAFLAYFAAVMQLLFKYFHNARLCYQGPTTLPCIIGSITDNAHVLESYQYDLRSKSYYLVGSSDHKALIAGFLDAIR